MPESRSAWRRTASRAVTRSRVLVRRARRFVRTHEPLVPWVTVVGANGKHRTDVLATLGGSPWFLPRTAEPPQARPQPGIGHDPAWPVAVVHESEPQSTRDLLALCRTAVLTAGEEPQAVNGEIWPAAQAGELRAEAAALASQREFRDRVAHLQRRDALSRGSMASLTAPRSVSMLCATNRPEQIDTVLQNAARQTGVDRQLVLVTHGFTPPKAALTRFSRDFPQVDLVHETAPKEWTLGWCLNAGIDRADGEDIVKVDDDNFYGEHFLLDLSRDLRLSGAAVTGKYAHYVHLEGSGAVVLRFGGFEHRWAHIVQGGSMYFAGDVLRRLRFGDLPRAVDTDILNRLRDEGGTVYSSDRYNFVSVRRADPLAHTWKVTDATLLTASGVLAFYGDPTAHVAI